MGPKLTQAEGFVLGTAAKMFTIAGPVIVNDVCAGVSVWAYRLESHTGKMFALYAAFLCVKRENNGE